MARVAAEASAAQTTLIVVFRMGVSLLTSYRIGGTRNQTHTKTKYKEGVSNLGKDGGQLVNAVGALFDAVAQNVDRCAFLDLLFLDLAQVLVSIHVGYAP